MNNSPNLKLKTVCIIGLGKMGLYNDVDLNNNWIVDQTTTHTKAVYTSKELKLIELVDKNINKLNDISYINGLSKINTNYKLSKNSQSDFLIVSTPTETHLTLIKLITTMFPNSHILLEKPMGKNSAQALEIYRLVQKNNQKLYINYFRRYLPNLRNLLNSREFINRGNLLNVEINAYGSLRNIFSHFFDLLVYCQGRTILDNCVINKVESHANTKLFTDISSKVQYVLNGIGELENPCSMEMIFERYSVSFQQDGANIILKDQKNSNKQFFNIDKNLFSHYQSIVLNEISKDFSKPTNYFHILDCISIHKFIESIV